MCSATIIDSTSTARLSISKVETIYPASSEDGWRNPTGSEGVKSNPTNSKGGTNHTTNSRPSKKIVPNQWQWCHCTFHWKINLFYTTNTSIPNLEKIHRICQSHCHSHTRCNFISKKTTHELCHSSWKWVCARIYTPIQRGWENGLAQILIQLISQTCARCGQQSIWIKNNLLNYKITSPTGS